MSFSRLVLCVVLAAVAPGADVSFAQTPAPLRIWVTDPSGAAIPGASVVVFRDGAVVTELITGDRGGVDVPSPGPGDYVALATAPGFDSTQQPFTVVAGRAHAPVTLSLPVAGVEDNVVVAGTAADAGATAFALSDAEIDALPDDEEALLQYLQELAGPGAEVRVDGFGGRGRPPTRDQILRITVRRDAYSAEFPQPGQGRIEILTRPNADRWRVNGNMQVRPSSWSANNAMARDRASGSLQRYNGSLAGPIRRNRTAVFFQGGGTTSEDSRGIAALMPAGPFVTAVDQPSNSVDFTARLETMIGRQSLVRISWSGERNARSNQGLSELDLPERGFERRGMEQSIRASLDGGTRLPYSVRLRWEGNRDETRPDTIAPAIVVNNAFRAGGATQAGEDRSHVVDAEGAVTLVAAPFVLRAGGQLTWNNERQGQVRNTQGTFTFLNLADYVAGVPATYTRRTGAQPLTIDTLQAAMFLQADFTWKSGWSLGAGARYQVQTHLDDRAALSPRIGVSRSVNGGRTAIRGGVGTYYGWLPTNVWEETIRLGRGSAEQEIIIRNPGFPNPLAAGEQQPPRVEPPTSVTIVDGADLARWTRASLGFSHQLPGNVRVNADVYRLRTTGEWRAVDVNAPAGGVRPDLTRGRVLRIDSIGRVSEHGFAADVSYGRDGRFASLRYSFSRRWSDGEDALTPPPDGRTFDTEWAPSRGDRGHMVNWGFNWQFPMNLTANIFGRWSQGGRYNVTTGRDENGDAYFNERPVGISRNDRRGSASTAVDLRMAWRVPVFGAIARPRGAVSPQRGPGGPRGGQGGPRGGPPAQAGGRGPAARPERSFEAYFSVNNLFNRVNYTSFVGVLTSPLFGQPTSAQAGRRIEVGWRLNY